MGWILTGRFALLIRLQQDVDAEAWQEQTDTHLLFHPHRGASWEIENASQVFRWGFLRCVSVWIDNLSQAASVCVIHRAHRGVMACEPLSGNAGVSFFCTRWKLDISNLQVFSPHRWEISPGWFVFCQKAEVSREETLISWFDVMDHNPSEAWNHFFLSQKPTSAPYSTAFVALASQVWIPSAHAQRFSLRQSHTSKEFVLEEIASGKHMVLRLSSDALGHLIRSL